MKASRAVLMAVLSMRVAAAGTAPAPDACQDFYQYACADWIAAHPLPADRSAWDPYDELSQKNDEAVRAILEGRGTAGLAEARKIQDDYATCLDERTINAAGLRPLSAELAAIDAIRTVADSVAALARVQSLGAEPLFTLWADQDPADSNRVIASLDIPGLGMTDRQYYVATDAASAKLRAAYQRHVARMLELSGLPPAAATAGGEAVLKLETALALAAPTREQRRDPNSRHHSLTGAQLAALTPSFPWPDYFRAARVAAPDSLNVDSPDFLRAATDAWLALGAVERKAYLRWKVVNELSDVLPSTFASEDFDFYGKTLKGSKQMPPRWERCAQMTNGHLGEAIGRVFVASHFPATDKERVRLLIGAIQSALREDIAHLDWMTDTTRTEALAKLEAYRAKVGYPDAWRDYSALEIRRGDALGNMVRANRFETARQLAKLGKPVDRDEWFSLPQEVDGYQSASSVQIVFTAGFLQPPFFDSGRDDASNLGALGRAIGHELSHGFDDHGRKYDRHGNLRDWWSPTDAAAFEHRAQCFVDEYSRFEVVDDQKLNGRLTLGENIADNGGMRLAYAALEKRLGDRPRVKVDGFTPEQRLFLAFARTQCANMTPQTLHHRVLTDPHSPGKFRVNGTLINMPQFQSAFACKPTDAMVSAHPCRLW